MEYIQIIANLTSDLSNLTEISVISCSCIRVQELKIKVTIRVTQLRSVHSRPHGRSYYRALGAQAPPPEFLRLQ